MCLMDKTWVKPNYLTFYNGGPDEFLQKLREIEEIGSLKQSFDGQKLRE